MKRWNIYLCAILVAALLVAMTGCRAYNVALPTVPGAEGEQNQPVEALQPPETELLDDDTTTGAADESGQMTDNTEPQKREESLTQEPQKPEELRVLRVQDVSQALLESLMGEGGDSTELSFFQITTREELESFWEICPSEILSEACQVYDGEFFAEYDLILIPRVTNTGSARHTSVLSLEEGKAAITIQVEVPEICTMDMANWTLLQAIPKSCSGTVSVTMASSEREPVNIGGNIP